MKRKLCRAAACPRKVNDTALFCGVHLRQLTPPLLSPIANNAEAPNTAGPEIRGKISRAVRNAVVFLAKKEGRSGALAQATRAAAVQPGQGGAGDSPFGGGGIDGFDGQAGTGRFDLST